MGDIKEGDEINCPIYGNRFVVGDDSLYIFMEKIFCSESCLDKAIEKYKNTKE